MPYQFGAGNCYCPKIRYNEFSNVSVFRFTRRPGNSSKGWFDWVHYIKYGDNGPSTTGEKENILVRIDQDENLYVASVNSSSSTGFDVTVLDKYGSVKSQHPNSLDFNAGYVEAAGNYPGVFVSDDGAELYWWRGSSPTTGTGTIGENGEIVRSSIDGTVAWTAPAEYILGLSPTYVLVARYDRAVPLQYQIGNTYVDTLPRVVAYSRNDGTEEWVAQFRQDLTYGASEVNFLMSISYFNITNNGAVDFVCDENDESYCIVNLINTLDVLGSPSATPISPAVVKIGADGVEVWRKYFEDGSTGTGSDLGVTGLRPRVIAQNSTSIFIEFGAGDYLLMRLRKSDGFIEAQGTVGDGVTHEQTATSFPRIPRIAAANDNALFLYRATSDSGDAHNHRMLAVSLDLDEILWSQLAPLNGGTGEGPVRSLTVTDDNVVYGNTQTQVLQSTVELPA